MTVISRSRCGAKESACNRFRRYSVLGMGALLAFQWGCTTSSVSNTPRTSTEQLLVANAVDQSLDKVNFASFNGQKVFLQEKYVDCVDKNYVIASTRHRLLAAGAALVDSADKATVVLEVRNGAVGTASADSFIGTPEIALPGMLTVPEVRFIERKRQMAIAKLGLVAIDPRTNTILGSGGTSLARADDNNWFVAGIGPYQDGTVRSEISRSTHGQAAVKQMQLPNTVAFQPPPQEQDPDAPQYAEENMIVPPAVSPASHDAPATKLLKNPLLPW